MKIKYNIPILNVIKEKIGNIKLKIENNKQKVPMKYYTLLILMLIIGGMTYMTNLKKYNDINEENYTKYTLDNEIEVDTNIVENVMYETAISSISTNISNIENTYDNNNDANLEQGYIWPVSGDVIKDHAIETLVYSKTLDMWRVHPRHRYSR